MDIRDRIESLSLGATTSVWRWRQHLVRDLAGEVLEIGAGMGANFAHYRRAAAVHAIEPDPERAERARRSAEAASAHTGIPIEVQVAPGEHLPYADDQFDVVVSSLVFCSVTDPQQVLAEIERVLRPAGVLWMVEHVRPQTQAVAQIASAATPLWSRIAHNCHLDRPTIQTLTERGWRVTVLRRIGVFVKLRAIHPSFPSSVDPAEFASR